MKGNEDFFHYENENKGLNIYSRAVKNFLNRFHHVKLEKMGAFKNSTFITSSEENIISNKD